MEREALQSQLRHCPLRVRMNDGREYIIEKPEFAIVGDYAASVLYRREDGKLLNGLMGLMNISMVEPLGIEGTANPITSNGQS